MRVVTPVRAAWLLAAVICLSSSFGAGTSQVPAASWLDRPLTSWNTAGGTVPKPPAAEEEKAEDQRLVRDGVEVVGGMSGADGMCRPANYNLFVFVDGRFAGTLSPMAMTSRLDGSSGEVRLPVPQLTAEFARYSPQDPLCCPSSRVTVRYRIDRLPAGPLVVPGGCQDHARTVGTATRRERDGRADLVTLTIDNPSASAIIDRGPQAA